MHVDRFTVEIEGAGVVPTLPLLLRLAAALDATFDIHGTDTEATVRFQAPAA